MLVEIAQQAGELRYLIGADDALVDDEVDIDIEGDLLDGHVDEAVFALYDRGHQRLA